MTEYEAAVLTELTRIRELLETRQAGELGLLRAIHNTCADAEFNCVELLQHAALPQNAELRTALEREFGDANTRRIGKRLAALQGRNVDGLIVESLGKDAGGHIWSVRVCEAKHTSPVARRADAVMLRIHDGGIGK